MAVYLIGTLDSKGRELAFVRQQLQQHGAEVVLVDVSCLGDSDIECDLGPDEVFQAAGTTVRAIREQGDRGAAVAAATAGATRLLQTACDAGQVSGVIALGGSAGTTIGTAAMRALPLEVPKLMVSTMASGQTRPYVGGRNILMLNSVVDVAGLNRISRTVLSQAAAALAGMLQQTRAESPAQDQRPLIAATMFGVTTPCVQRAQAVLEASGYEVLVFHATGNGGEAMEGLISEGLIAGVLDLTTTELADELAGGVLSAGPDRLTAAGRRGIPQVISVGALDMVNFGPQNTVPDRLSHRRFHRHNASVTLIRTTPEECRQLGEQIGRKAAAATGPVSILFPQDGISAIDGEGRPFDDRLARDALLSGILATCGPVQVDIRSAHINDESFATAAAEELLRLLQHKTAAVDQPGSR